MIRAIVLFLIVAGIAAAGSGGSLPGEAAVAPVPQAGDADCSATVDSMDALYILREVAGIEPRASCVLAVGDVDCVLGLAATDALHVLRHVVGLRTDPLAHCGGEYRLVQVFSGGFEQAVEFAMYPGSTDVGVVAEHLSGMLYKVSLSGSFPPQLFADLSDRVGGSTQLEGFLAFAFSPDFEQDGRLYTWYTTGPLEPIVLSRFQVLAGVVDPTSETVILSVPQFSGYNVGGHIDFDSAGNLYLSVGDGGGPAGSGQDNTHLRGKVLRIKVAGEETYSIPPDNPFVGVEGADEIFATGFRNPWRMSIDPQTDKVWLGDVGELQWEEVNLVHPGGNYGWDSVEGGFCTGQTFPCDPADFDPPRYYFEHKSEFTSITGGLVYRGQAIQALEAWYVFASFYSGEVFALNTETNDEAILLAEVAGFLPVSFVALPSGELGILNFDGAVYRLEPL